MWSICRCGMEGGAGIDDRAQYRVRRRMMSVASSPVLSMGELLGGWKAVEPGWEIGASSICLAEGSDSVELRGVGSVRRRVGGVGWCMHGRHGGRCGEKWYVGWVREGGVGGLHSVGEVVVGEPPGTSTGNVQLGWDLDLLCMGFQSGYADGIDVGWNVGIGVLVAVGANVGAFGATSCETAQTPAREVTRVTEGGRCGCGGYW